MKKIIGLLRLFRFELPFSAGVCVIMGQLFALGKFTAPLTITLAFGAVFFISASILILNDYIDVETDKINAPHRPIPSNLVTPAEALVLAVIVLLLGLLLSIFINILAFLCSVLLFIIGFLYNWKFKKSGLPGNLMVSFSVAMTFVFGSITVGQPLNKIVLFFSLIAFLVDLGEEIANDAMDVKGDVLINSNSIAIKYGQLTALNISVYIFFTIVLLTAIPFILKWFPLVYLLPFTVMDSIIIFSTIKLKRSEKELQRKYLRWIYLGSTLGLLIFIIIIIGGV